MAWKLLLLLLFGKAARRNSMGAKAKRRQGGKPGKKPHGRSASKPERGTDSIALNSTNYYLEMTRGSRFFKRERER